MIYVATILRPCPNELPCPGFDSPLANYSSEAPDPLDFISTQPWADSGGPPPFGGPWTKTACGITFTSYISQEDADLQALAASILCLHQDWPPIVPPGGGSPTQIIYNEAQTCVSPCPGGGSFVFTIAAGLIAGNTLSEANNQAHALACYFAQRRRRCLPSLHTNAICADSPYSDAIVSPVPIADWTITGTLPPGLSTLEDSASLTLSGTLTTPGVYNFTITANALDGGSLSKDYTINVVGITNSSPLPAGTVGTAYNQTLTAIGGTAPYSFAVTTGALPDGLTLDSTTGVISGTPTTAASTLFTVTVTDAATLNCPKDLTITVNSTAPTVTAYYTLDSAAPVSGDMVDSVAGLHMFKQPGLNSPNIPALISNGLQRSDSFNSQYTTGAVSALAYPDTGGWSMFGWFNMNMNAAVAANVAAELVLGVGNGSVFIDVGSSSNPAPIEVSWTDANFQSVQSYFSATFHAWHFFHIYYDPVAQKIGISFDNNAPFLTGTGVSFTPDAQGVWDFFGPFFTVGLNTTWDEIGLKLDRKLTSAEQAFLYNGGAGRTWPL